MFVLRANNLQLPAPVSMSVNDEIIWSSDTGRTLNGTMVGDVIAEKKNISIKWQWLTDQEVKTLKKNLVAGFFPLTIYDNGETITIDTYRSTLSKECACDVGDGVTRYKSVSVDIIQR